MIRPATLRAEALKLPQAVERPHFDWARFRRTKGAIKLHMVLDHDGYLPVFALITNGNVHDLYATRFVSFLTNRVLRLSLFTYRELWLWLANPFEVPPEQSPPQLTLVF